MNTEDWLNEPALESISDVEALNTLNDSQAFAVAQVRAIADVLARAVSAATPRLARGGRLIFVGAGASARIAVQEGVELAPTYNWPDSQLVYLIAGGERALLKSVEGAEDDEAAALEAIDSLKLTADDVVVGVAASGRTPYTSKAIERAREQDALTIGIANNAPSRLLTASEHALPLITGAEVIAGSTRMAAGTAQKVCLNQFTTLCMVRLGKTYQNLMVDMAAKNEKLAGRRLVMLQRIYPQHSAAKLSEALGVTDGHVKLAAVWLQTGDLKRARAQLTQHGGHLARCLVSD